MPPCAVGRQPRCCCGLVVWGKFSTGVTALTIGKPIGDLTIGLRDKVAVVLRDKVAVGSATKWPWISGSTHSGFAQLPYRQLGAGYEPA